MDLETKVTWRDGMTFEAELGGFHLTLDADPKFGGRGLGPKPNGLTLTSLAGCTGMDVMSILGKMRVEVDAFEVTAEGDLAEEHPKTVQRIVLRYRFEGKDLPLNKVRRAVNLSEERYCGIRATLAPTVEMVSEIYVNGELLTAEAA